MFQRHSSKALSSKQCVVFASSTQESDLSFFSFHEAQEQCKPTECPGGSVAVSCFYVILCLTPAAIISSTKAVVLLSIVLPTGVMGVCNG